MTSSARRGGSSDETTMTMLGGAVAPVYPWQDISMASDSGVRSGPTGPVAAGTLGGVPLAHALIYIRNKTLSGVLELRASAERSAWLVFSRGLVVSSMTTPAVARFGTVAFEMGFIDATVLGTSTVAAASSKRPQMDVLLDDSVITTVQRDAVLVEQMRRRVHHLFTLPPATTFTFREGRPSATQPLVTVDLLAPVWRGLRELSADPRSADVLGRIGDHPLRLLSDAVVERAELTPEEVALCQALARTPMTLAQLRTLAKQTKLSRSRIDRLVYLLVITRCVEVEGAEHAPLPSGAMWAATRASASTNVATNVVTKPEGAASHTSTERLLAAAAKPEAPIGPADVGEDGIRLRAAHLSTETPFATLGLPEGASAEAARAAFFRLGRLWNPDRIPASLEDVRGEIERIFAHMTQAHHLLTDPAVRPASDTRVARNGR